MIVSTRLLRRAPLLSAALLLAGCAGVFGPGPAPAPRISPQAYEYLDSALNLMQSHALQKDQVDWPAFREGVILRAGGAQEPGQTHATINAALQQLNRHSFLMPPRTGTAGGPPAAPPTLVATRLQGGRYGYIRTVSYGGGDPHGHAQAYHDFIREVDTEATCGWVVDLRDNTGGNMWPMLAGVGPVLGEGSPGGFVGQGGVRTPWYYADGAAGTQRGAFRNVSARAGRPYRLRRQAPPVAILTGERTASAAEAVAIAFRGRPDARSFGAATRGVPTANVSFQMPDGASVVLTTAWEADRDGVVYQDRIQPDEVMAGTSTGEPATDPVLARAVQWLAAHPACRETPAPE